MTSIWYCLGLLFGHGRTWGLAPTCFNQQNWNHAEAIVVVRLKQQNWGLLLLVWCYLLLLMNSRNKMVGPDMGDNDGQQSIGIFQEIGFIYIYIYIFFAFQYPRKWQYDPSHRTFLGWAFPCGSATEFFHPIFVVLFLWCIFGSTAPNIVAG